MRTLPPLALLLAGCGARLPDPQPEAVVPDHGWTGEDTRIAITGSRFYPQIAVPASGGDPDIDASYEVDLVSDEGTYAVGGVTLRDYHLLDALVPSGIPPGTYDLVVTNSAGRVGTSAVGRRCTYSGISLMSPRLLDGWNDSVFPLREPLRQAAGRGALSGEIWTGDWEDVGTPERYAALNRRLALRPESPPA